MRRQVQRRAFVALALAVVALATGAQIFFERLHYATFEQRVATLHLPSDDGRTRRDRRRRRAERLLLGSRQTGKAQLLALVVFAGGLALGIGLRGPRSSFLAAVATTVLLAGMQQLALAFYAAAAFLAWLALARGRWKKLEISVLLGVLASGAVAWLAVLIAGPAHLSPLRALRAIAGFPQLPRVLRASHSGCPGPRRPRHARDLGCVLS
jgi:hypothetical protein